AALDDAHDDAAGAQVAVGGAAEACDAGDGVREVHADDEAVVEVVLEAQGGDGLDEVADLVVGDGGQRGLAEDAGDAHGGGYAGLDVDVGRVVLNGEVKECLKVHRPSLPYAPQRSGP